MDSEAKGKAISQLKKEGEICGGVGSLVTVSDMELMVLCNFAYLGVIHSLSLDSVREGCKEDMEQAKALEDAFLASLNKELRDVTRFREAAIGMLRMGRFVKYVSLPG